MSRVWKNSIEIGRATPLKGLCSESASAVVSGEAGFCAALDKRHRVCATSREGLARALPDVFSVTLVTDITARRSGAKRPKVD